MNQIKTYEPHFRLWHRQLVGRRERRLARNGVVVVVNEPLGVNHLGGNLALAQNRHALARQHRARQRPHLGRVGVRLDEHKRRVAHRLGRRTALAGTEQTHPSFSFFLSLLEIQYSTLTDVDPCL
jgi:hypothetical protein